jgi:hypothetical protein
LNHFYQSLWSGIYPRKWLASISLALFWAAAAFGQVWQFDLDASDAPAAETQPGFMRMSVPGMTGDSTNGSFAPVATAGGITVTATAAGGFRDRGAGNLLAGEPKAPLLRDFIFTDGAGAQIRISIEGLPAGTWDVRSFHFDNASLGSLANNAFDLVVQDARGTVSYRELLWSVEGSNFEVESDGAKPVTVIVRENNPNNRARFNGLQIVRRHAFDVDAHDAPGSETQPGFTRLTSPQVAGDSVAGVLQVSAVAGPVAVTASVVGGFRDKGNTGPLTDHPFSEVLRDFLFSDLASGAIEIRISGLPPGSHEVRSFHYDPLEAAAGEMAFDLTISDADGHRAITNQEWSVSGVRYTVRSDGAAVLVTVREANTRDRVRFNGIEIGGGGERLVPWQVPAAVPGDHVNGNMITVNDNGGWCWYQDEKVIYDPVSGSIIASTAANHLGYGGLARDRQIEVSSLQLATGRRTRAVMGTRDSRGDDHNMGALWIRPDGRYIHFWTGHNDSTRNSYHRFSVNPNNAAQWGPELFFNWRAIGNPDASGNITYNNLHYLVAEGSGAGRLYNIGRESQRSPNIAYSDDWGHTWKYGGKLTLTRSASSYSNGYLKFSGNGIDRIDFITTEHHPRDFNTSIYHGYIQNGKSFNSFGQVVDSNIFDENAPAPEDFTPVFLSSPEDGVNDHLEYHRAWTIELERDDLGHPHGLFTTRYGTNVASNRSGDADHRLFYARFDGAQWHTTELGKMGGPLYFSEQDYTGLGAIHPDNPGLLFISSPFDPRDDRPLRKHEIFRGVTNDRGRTWKWTPVTYDSTVDNLRPAIPKWDAAHTALCWLRGDYVTQRDFDQTLVCMIESPEEIAAPMIFSGATLENTTFADGSPVVVTGPTDGTGLADGQWHLDSSFGNSGAVFSAGESADEDAPMLRTTVVAPAEGLYDVFVLFWSRPGEDWRVRAGFAPPELTVFRRYSSAQCATNEFTSPVNVLNKDVALYRAYVGRQAVPNGGAFSLYIDDFDGQSFAGEQRTVYEGVAIAPVWPMLRIAEIERTSEKVVITVPGYAGYVYQLQRCVTLSGGEALWETIGAPVPGAGAAGAPVLLELEDMGLPGEASFYRVEIRK